MIFHITSSKNEKFKQFKALKTKKARTKTGLYTVEGIKSVTDAIDAKAPITAFIISKSLFEKNEFCFSFDIDTYVINDEIFDALSTTETPQGVMAILKQHNYDCSLSIDKAYIYCDRLQDPGNAGTIIRTADAAGFGGVLFSPDCADIYNPKTVRSSMGSFFHTNIYEDVCYDKLKGFKEQGFTIVSGVLNDNSVNYTLQDFKKPVIIVIGNEANGISPDILSLSDVFVKIPIDGKAESLNAAIAAAILMYEVNRQRNIKN